MKHKIIFGRCWKGESVFFRSWVVLKVNFFYILVVRRVAVLNQTLTFIVYFCLGHFLIQNLLFYTTNIEINFILFLQNIFILNFKILSNLDYTQSSFCPGDTFHRLPYKKMYGDHIKIVQKTDCVYFGKFKKNSNI